MRKSDRLETCEDPRTKTSRHKTLGQAEAWGRTAASLGWGLADLDDEVDPRFHKAAIAAYHSRMATLYPCPF